MSFRSTASPDNGLFRRIFTATAVIAASTGFCCCSFFEPGSISAQESFRIGDSEVATDTLVVCPPALEAALRPWIEYRTTQGHGIRVIHPARTPPAIKRQIQELAAVHPIRFIVIVGDAPDPDGRNRHLATPTDYVPSRVVRDFGSEPEIATDNSYADINGDGVPDLAIGRLPSDSPEELETLVGKIIDYERAPSGIWQRQINFVAGTGGFGTVTDGVIEKASRGIISELIPGEYSVSLTWGDWSSAYCPDPRKFSRTTVDRLNDGCQFWVYMGHGRPEGLDYVRTPAGGYPMLRKDDMQHLQCMRGKPVALMLACYTGAFDMPGECLAEELVQHPGGPIAVVCSSRVATPYGMSVLGLGMMEGYFAGRDTATLGELVLDSKKKLFRSGEAKPAEPVREMIADQPVEPQGEMAKRHQEFRQIVRALGEAFSPTGPRLEEEAREHVHLFHLLGDPLLRLNRPEIIPIEAVVDVNDGSAVVIRGTAPRSGNLVVELELARDRLPVRNVRREDFDASPRSLEEYQRVYEQANSRLLASRQIRVEAGEFETRLELPETARGRCIIRGTLMEPGTGRVSLGAVPLQVLR
jgi:Peptidase family C25